MDSRVAARFFRVSPKPDNATDFPDLLLKCAAKAQRTDREREVHTGVVLRVERCKLAPKDFIVGEFCRKQTANIPPQAGPGGLAPINLGKGQGLGHVAAFRYHKPTRVLLLQGNPQCASPRRIAAYLGMVEDGTLYTFEPVLREDAWARLGTKRVRSLTVKFASVANLEALDKSGIAAAQGARLIAQAYQGVEVELTVSVGRSRKNFLADNVITKSIRELMASDAKLKDLTVKTSRLDGADNIDFLEEHLKQEDELNLPESDPDGNYQRRKSYLKSVFSGNMAYLLKLYGIKN